jgi:hypothetical protein
MILILLIFKLKYHSLEDSPIIISKIFKNEHFKFPAILKQALRF